MFGKRGFFVLPIIVLFFFLLYLAGFEARREGIHTGFTEISVITREVNSELFETVRQGMEQAASDLDAELSFITLTKRNDVEEQKRMLEREINNGTDAIILFAADSEAMTEAVSSAMTRVPVVLVESPVNAETVTTQILGQNFEMGRVLGERILYTGIYEKKILILESSMKCANIQEREKGILDALSGAETQIIREELPTDTNDVEVIAQKIKTTQADIVIALEPYSLEAAARAVQLAGYRNIRLHGLCATGKTAPFIEKNVIESVVVQNDFNMGYLSVRAVMKELGKTKESADAEIEFAIIHSYNMYSKEHQRLLFPFVR